MIHNFAELIHHFTAKYNDGEFEAALELLETESARFPAHTALVTCWQIAMLARTGREAEAVMRLDQALEAGYWYHETALRSDPDFVPLHKLPQFESLVKRSAEQRQTAVILPALTVFAPGNVTGMLPALVAFHGNNSNAVAFSEYWKHLVGRGWLVALPESSQASWLSDHFNWDNIEMALTETQQHLTSLNKQYSLASLVFAGVSMGGQLALRAAFDEQVATSSVAVRGIIAIEPWFAPEEFEQFRQSLRKHTALHVFLLCGAANKEFLEIAQNILEALTTAGIACTLEETPNAYHGMAANFDQSLDQALKYILG